MCRWRKSELFLLKAKQSGKYSSFEYAGKNYIMHSREIIRTSVDVSDMDNLWRAHKPHR